MSNMFEWKLWDELTESQKLIERIYPSTTKIINGVKYYNINIK